MPPLVFQQIPQQTPSMEIGSERDTRQGDLMPGVSFALPTVTNRGPRKREQKRRDENGFTIRLLTSLVVQYPARTARLLAWLPASARIIVPYFGAKDTTASAEAGRHGRQLMNSFLELFFLVCNSFLVGMINNTDLNIRFKKL